MIKLFLVGINGKMGKMICERANELDGYQIVGGYDMIADEEKNIYNDHAKIELEFDAIIDFSRPETLDAVIAIATKFTKPVVIATTGFNGEQTEKINLLSTKVPVFLSGNMSVGINLIEQLIKTATQKLFGSFDVEIIEKHHNQKVDSPSGTAKMLANAVKSGANESVNFIYGREGNDAKRKPNEVCIHAVRGGTIVGEHEAIFAGNDEIITISHSAMSRKVFADGSLKASEYLTSVKEPKIYNMHDMLK